VLIVDECHDMQSMQSIRTKKFMALALAPHCHGVIAISGTPMKNGPAKNIFPLLKACRHPLGDNQAALKNRYLRGRDKDLRQGVSERRRHQGQLDLQRNAGTPVRKSSSGFFPPF